MTAGGAQQVGVLVDRLDDGAERREEDRVLVGVVAGVEQVDAAVGDGPVVVLARAVHAGERLLVEEADEPVAVRDLAQHLHHEHVVVAAEVQFLEHRRKLELGGRNLVVACLRRNAELPEFLLDLVHEVEDAGADRTEVVVLQLLPLRTRRAEERAARQHEVGTLGVVLLVDQEVFLLGTERDRDARLALAEALHQALRGDGERLHGTEQRRLLVQRLARVGAEGRRNAEGRAVRVALDEGGRSRIPRRVAARLERGADAAGGETRRIRLAHDQVLAGEG